MNKKLMGLLMVGAVGATAFFTTTEATSANAVQKTSENCINAHAILMASATGNHSIYWEAISGVVASRMGTWKVVSDYATGAPQQFSFRQYDTKFTEGGTAYVAHCGTGRTCNNLAEAVLKRYPESGSPSVWCGDVPHILDNPQSASVK